MDVFSISVTGVPSSINIYICLLGAVIIRFFFFGVFILNVCSFLNKIFSLVCVFTTFF